MVRGTRTLAKITPSVKDFLALEDIGDPSTDIGRDKFAVFLAMWSGSNKTEIRVQDPRTADDSFKVDASTKALVDSLELYDGLYYLKTYTEFRKAVTEALPDIFSYYTANKEPIKEMVSEAATVLIKKELKVQNLESLCKSIRISPQVASFMLSHTGLLVRFEATLKPGGDASKWAQYHLTESSTPTLLKKFYDETQLLVGHVPGYNSAVIVKIQDSDPEKYDHGIPPNIIAHAYCYFKAANYNFGNWYQGNSAISAQSATFKQSWIDFYTKYIELTSTHPALPYATSIDDIKNVANGTADLNKLKNDFTVAKAMNNSYLQALSDSIKELLSTHVDSIAANAVEVKLGMSSEQLTKAKQEKEQSEFMARLKRQEMIAGVRARLEGATDAASPAGTPKPAFPGARH